MTTKITYTIGGKEVEFNLNDKVAPNRIKQIVDAVINNMFDEEGNYNPSNFDYVLTYVLLTEYTDIKVEGFDVKDIFALADDSDFVAILDDKINHPQMYRIKDSIWTLANIKANEHPLTKTCKYINEFIEAFGENIKEAMNNEQIVAVVKELLEAKK